MKLFFSFIFLMFLSFTSFSQYTKEVEDKLIYCVTIEHKYSKEKPEIKYLKTQEQVELSFFLTFDYKIDVSKVFTGINLYFQHENDNEKFRCELAYIDEKGKIKKIKITKY